MLTITTLAEFARAIYGGVVTNDRGNGCGGPAFLGEGDDLKELLDTPLRLVSADDDPDAWRLAREALDVLDILGEPEYVAVGERADGDNGHQLIYVG